jgi:hypothetical protein
MDTESPRVNQELLHSLIDQHDPVVMGLVGMEALHILALEMPAEKFKIFIEGAVERAKQMHSQVQEQSEEENGEQP